MSDIDCDVLDAESLENLLEPTVEVPAVLLLGAGGCCGCPRCRTPRHRFNGC